jgi:hypothetical protein
MGLILDVARVSAAANVVLLAVLVGIWARSYSQIRSRHTLGALVFALFLLAENALALYYYVTGLAVPPPALRAMMYLQVLEAVGIAAYTYVTLD